MRDVDVILVGSEMIWLYPQILNIFVKLDEMW